MQGINKKFENELNELVNTGTKILKEFSENNEKSLLGYQSWYSRALSVIEHLLPDRLDEFKTLYEGDKKDNTTIHGYGIKTYLLDFQFK